MLDTDIVVSLWFPLLVIVYNASAVIMGQRDPCAEIVLQKCLVPYYGYARFLRQFYINAWFLTTDRLGSLC
jgi:hypothetical protein